MIVDGIPVAGPDREAIFGPARIAISATTIFTVDENKEASG
jgi:hypothetical protein